jgi:D-alanyl-D-alanine carboxypeptidase (penicillin-binding protein 5/6)
VTGGFVGGLRQRAVAVVNALLAAFVLATTPAAAQDPTPPDVAARQHLLIDLSSGRVLAAHEADASIEPAGATALMTAYVALNALQAGRPARDSTVAVSPRAHAERRPGVPLMYAEGTMRIDELLRGVAVLGARDAAVALAEAVSGSVDAFVAQMNRQSLALGLTQTVFRNPTGEAASGQTTTARDLARLATRLVADQTEALPLFALRQLQHAGVRQDNPNLLLARDGSIDGLAVMAGETSGHGVVATALRDTPAGPRRLLVVLAGAPSRDAAAGEAQKLLNWGWQAWDAVRLFAAGQPVTTVPVWKGTSATVPLGASGALVVTVPRGEGGRLRTTLTRTDPLVAPLVQGQDVGRIDVVTTGGSAVASVPLVVQQPVPLAGVLGRAWDAIRLWIR